MLKKCIVLFSGGQDSTTCLYWAKKHFDEVFALNIYYKQRHWNEIKSAGDIAKLANVKLLTHNIDLFEQIDNSNLLSINKSNSINNKHYNNNSLPSSFVPGRNIIFMTICAMYAYKLEIKDIVIGVNVVDFSGYPDCRPDTIKTMQQTIENGISKINIHTPLIDLNKIQIVKLAQKLNGCMKALSYSHTCYNNKIPPCGICPACVIRAKGFKEANIEDPLLKRLNTIVR